VAADETILPADAVLTTKCMAVLAPDAEALGWRYGRSVLSRSDRWGWVWRSDVVTRTGHRSRIVVTWQSPADAERSFFAYYSFPEPPLP
jgi:hypothetical protein